MADQAYRFADARTRTRMFTHGALLVLGAFIAGLVLSWLGLAVFQAQGYDPTALPPAPTAVVTALQFVGFLAVGYWYVVATGSRDLLHRRSTTARDLGWIVAGLLGLTLTFVGLNQVLGALGVDVASNQAVQQGREQPRLLLYFVVTSLLFVAPGEELIFRGLVQGLVRRAYGVVPAVVLTAVVFGLVHYVALGGTGSRLAYLAIAALLGLVLGAVYEYTENLVVPVAVHGCWNAGQFLLVYAVEMGWLGAGP